MSCVFVHKSNCNFKNVLVTPAPVSCLVSYTVNVEIFVKMSKISVHVNLTVRAFYCNRAYGQHLLWKIIYFS